MTTQEHLAYITNYIQVHCPDKKQEIKKWIESYDAPLSPEIRMNWEENTIDTLFDKNNY